MFESRSDDRGSPSLRYALLTAHGLNAESTLRGTHEDANKSLSRGRARSPSNNDLAGHARDPVNTLQVEHFCASEFRPEIREAGLPSCRDPANQTHRSDQKTSRSNLRSKFQAEHPKRMRREILKNTDFHRDRGRSQIVADDPRFHRWNIERRQKCPIVRSTAHQGPTKDLPMEPSPNVVART